MTSNATATEANHTAHGLDQLKSILNLFEEESKSANIMPSSPEDDPYFGIKDSLTLKQNVPRLVLDASDGEHMDVDSDISQEEVDRAWEDFDASWEHSISSVPSCTTPKRSGVRRGRRVTAESSSSETLTVMTKTHDGASEDGFLVIDNGSAAGSRVNTASAA